MTHDVYIHLQPGQVARSRQLRADIHLDLDAAGQPVGLEILGATDVEVDGTPAIIRRCPAYHPAYGFSCILPRPDHPGTHFDLEGGHWSHERGQVWQVADIADLLEHLAEPTVAHGKWILGQMARRLREAIADAMPAPVFPVPPLMLPSGVALLYLLNLQVEGVA